MCSDCAGGVSCGDTGEQDELEAHLVDDGMLAVPICGWCGAELTAYEQDMDYTTCYACDCEMNAQYSERSGGDGA